MAAWFTRKAATSAVRVEPRPAERKEPRISFAGFAQDAHLAELARVEAAAQSFQPYQPPAGVRGANIAMDDAMALPAEFGAWVGENVGILESYIADGLSFQGYPHLAQMMQRAEFRKPVDVLAKECTREWIRFRSKKQAAKQGNDKAAAKRISEIETAFKSFNIREVIREQIRHGLGYGIGHVWADVGGLGYGATDQERPLRVNKTGMTKGSLRRFANVEPIWTTPANYNADTPLRDDFYKPSVWWVQGSRVHSSRMKSLVPFPVSQMLAPAFNFGGLSLTQQLKTYVHNFLRLRNSVSSIAANFSKLVLLTDMFGNMATPQHADYGDINPSSLTGRANLLQSISDGQDTIVADKEKEDAKILATPLGGLNELLAQAMEAMASIPGIPLVKLFGIQPTGLNASSDGEIRVFYDEIAAWQADQIEPTLRWVFNLVQIHLWGDIDPDIDYEFVHLWQMDEKQAAEVEKLKADTDAVNIVSGKISSDEAREREATDDTSIYRNVNLTGPAPENPDDELDDGSMSGLLSKAENEE